MKKLDDKRAKELLELYFEGGTTLEQESELRAYFASGRADKDLERYAPIFGYFNDEINKIKRAESRRYWVKPRFLYSVPAAAAIALFTVLFWPQDEKQTGLRLVLDGLEINNDVAALSMADDRLAKMSEMMERVDTKTEPLEQLNKVEKAISGFNEITSKIK